MQNVLATGGASFIGLNFIHYHVNQMHLERGQLRVQKLGRGIVWLDACTHETLSQAANFVQTIEER